MAKPKFTLTTDLIKVEPEPQERHTQVLSAQATQPVEQKKIEEKEPISLKISKQLKKEFQMWCIMNGKSMTEALEEVLQTIIQDKNNFSS
jgi:hypothetical protein